MSAPQLGLIQAVVAEEHAGAILNHVLGHEEMCRRTFKVTVQYNRGNPNSTPSIFTAHVRACYREGHFQPLIPFIENAVAFYAGPPSPSPPFPHTYPSTSYQWYHILDVRTNNLSLIVPLGMYAAYLSRSTGYATGVLDRIEPRPYWVVPSETGGMGVPIAPRVTAPLRYGESAFTHADGSARSTVYVRFQWPGYEPFERQLRVLSNASDSGMFQRVVTHVKNAVRAFISTHADAETSSPRWAVGNTHGRISENDVILLAIVEVSRGTIMPILKVRDGFVFPGAATRASSIAHGTFSRPATPSRAATPTPLAAPTGRSINPFRAGTPFRMGAPHRAGTPTPARTTRSTVSSLSFLQSIDTMFLRRPLVDVGFV
ncbi:unnamed protein product [Peniophora sp. CBMAI 1063]|nr:unnamed protein product [Peniophora sp. CBMAI 1063]